MRNVLAGRGLLSTRPRAANGPPRQKENQKIPVASSDRLVEQNYRRFYQRQRMVPLLIDNGRAGWRSEAPIVEEVAKVHC